MAPPEKGWRDSVSTRANRDRPGRIGRVNAKLMLAGLTLALVTLGHLTQPPRVPDRPSPTPPRTVWCPDPVEDLARAYQREPSLKHLRQLSQAMVALPDRHLKFVEAMESVFDPAALERRLAGRPPEEAFLARLSLLQMVRVQVVSRGHGVEALETLLDRLDPSVPSAATLREADAVLSRPDVFDLRPEEMRIWFGLKTVLTPPNWYLKRVLATRQRAVTSIVAYHHQLLRDRQWAAHHARTLTVARWHAGTWLDFPRQLLHPGWRMALEDEVYDERFLAATTLAQARYGALRIRVAHRLGRTITLPDPFDPTRPLRVDGDEVWSVGPDKTVDGHVGTGALDYGYRGDLQL